MGMRIALGIFNNSAANLRPRSKFIILIGILGSKVSFDVIVTLLRELNLFKLIATVDLTKFYYILLFFTSIFIFFNILFSNIKIYIRICKILF